MSFNDISYLELWWPFCSVEQKHLCNFGNRNQEEQFCEIILTLDKWFRRSLSLRNFLFVVLVALLFSGAEAFVQFW